MIDDHQEAETAGEPTEDATVMLVHGDGEGGVPWDPPDVLGSELCLKLRFPFFDDSLFDPESTIFF